MRHSNHRVAELPKEELEKEISTWTREQLIDWLSWNDPHGIYKDEDSLAELGNLMTIEEGREIMLRQIEEGRE